MFSGISVCGHLMMIASQIVAEYHPHEKRMNLKSKSLYKVAMLLQRFREAFSTWHVLQKKYKYAFLQKILENVADKLDKSFVDFKALVKVSCMIITLRLSLSRSAVGAKDMGNLL